MSHTVLYSEADLPAAHRAQSLLTIVCVWLILISMPKFRLKNAAPVDILILLGAFVNLLVIGLFVTAYIIK